MQKYIIKFYNAYLLLFLIIYKYNIKKKTRLYKKIYQIIISNFIIITWHLEYLKNNFW
jgi:hypothetical protein